MSNCKLCGTAIPQGSTICACGSPVPKWTVVDLILWLVVIGWLAALIIPALAPEKPQQANPAAAGSMIGILVVAYFLARRRRARRPWIWVFVALLGVFLINFTGALLRAYHKPQLAMDDLFRSIEMLDPVAAARLRGLENNQPGFQKEFQPILARAVQRAPDAAVLALASVQEQLVTPTSAKDTSRCVAAARGTSVPTETGISTKLQMDIIKAESDLIRASANNRQVPIVPGRADVMALMAPLYARIDPAGDLGDPSKFAKLSDEDQCQMYLKLMGGVHALTPSNAAIVFRYFIGAKRSS
jgi:hypothetical protein